MVSCISGVCVVALLFSQSLFTVMPRGERISVTVNSILPHVDMWVGSERCTLNHVVPSQPQLADTDIYIIPASLHARPFILPRPIHDPSPWHTLNPPGHLWRVPYHQRRAAIYNNIQGAS
jgi:hypothetical protein